MLNYQPTRDNNGTSLQGYITISYKELVKAFGKPHWTDGDKTTAEWCFKTVEGVVFTIYDYKNCSTPRGEYLWHIGGKGELVVAIVQVLFPNNKVEVY